MNTRAVGNNIRRLCGSRGITTETLAGRIGVNMSTMNNWCSGKRQITAYALLRVSRVLDTTMEELMKGIDDGDIVKRGGETQTDGTVH